METTREENAAEPAEGNRTRWVKWVLVSVAAIALVAVLTILFLQLVVGPATGEVFSTVIDAI